VIISRLCSASYNGFIQDCHSCPPVCVWQCPRLPGWQMSPRRRRPCHNCVLLTLEHSLSVGREAVLETGPLPPQDHKSGTVWHPIPHYMGCHTASSGGYWRHFYLDSEATTQSELFVTVLNRNILTYLLIIGIIVILSINSHSKCQQHKCHISHNGTYDLHVLRFSWNRFLDMVLLCCQPSIYFNVSLYRYRGNIHYQLNPQNQN